MFSDLIVKPRVNILFEPFEQGTHTHSTRRENIKHARRKNNRISITYKSRFGESRKKRVIVFVFVCCGMGWNLSYRNIFNHRMLLCIVCVVNRRHRYKEFNQLPTQQTIKPNFFLVLVLGKKIECARRRRRVTRKNSNNNTFVRWNVKRNAVAQLYAYLYSSEQYKSVIHRCVHKFYEMHYFRVLTRAHTRTHIQHTFDGMRCC